MSYYQDRYRQQMEFVDEKLLETIEGILSNSLNPPIIILQADHGPNMFDETQMTEPCWIENYAILNAYYLPGIGSAFIQPDISPVNTFRFIFNTYFHTKLEILPNREFISSNEHFYQFDEMTNLIKGTCEKK